MSDRSHTSPTLDEAQRNCEEYHLSVGSISVHSIDSAAACSTSEESSVPAECVSMETKCYFCDNKRHPRFKYLRETAFSANARKVIFPVFVCLNLNPAPTAALTNQQPSLSASAPVNSGDDKVNVFTLVNGVLANCLIDTGAKWNHIDKAFINRTNLSVNNSTKEEIGLAVKGSTVRTRGSCNVQIDLLDRSYEKVNMLAMDNLWDVLLGREFLR